MSKDKPLFAQVHNKDGKKLLKADFTRTDLNGAVKEMKEKAIKDIKKTLKELRKSLKNKEICYNLGKSILSTKIRLLQNELKKMERNDDK